MTKRFFFSFKIFYLSLLIFYHLSLPAWSWGFFAHKQINRYAITTLPPGMFGFYKKNLTFLTEKSVNPDKRRYRVKHEAAKHFIDIEAYDLHLFTEHKISFDQVIAGHGPLIVATHGQLPWAIIKVQQQLTHAFMQKDVGDILKLSADLGHYVADAHVPLHTTQNYDGQMTGQEGIHSLWETRLPLLFFNSYNLFVGQAIYIEDPLTQIWNIILQSHALVDSVLTSEKKLSKAYPIKYAFEQDGQLLKKQYSIAFSTAYHQALQGQIEERLQQSIIQVGNFWLTAWINAGSPKLDDLNYGNTAINDEMDQNPETTVLEGIRKCGD